MAYRDNRGPRSSSRFVTQIPPAPVFSSSSSLDSSYTDEPDEEYRSHVRYRHSGQVGHHPRGEHHEQHHVRHQPHVHFDRNFASRRRVNSVHYDDDESSELDSSDEDSDDESSKFWAHVHHRKNVISRGNYGCDSLCKPKLVVINSLDFISRPSGLSSLILDHADRSIDSILESAPKSGMMWLHIQRPCMSIPVLQSFIIECPIITPRARKLSLKICQLLSDNHTFDTGSGTKLRPRLMLRTFERSDDVEDVSTTRVTFTSTEYIALHEKNHTLNMDDNQQVMPLAQSMHGFDVGLDHGDGMISTSLAKISRDQVPHVGQLWLLLVGSNLLITFSEHTSEEIRGDLIKLDSGRQGVLSIKVRDEHDQLFRVVVEPDCSYAAFVSRTFTVVFGKSAERYLRSHEIRDDNHDVLRAEDWGFELATGKTEQQTFFLVPIIHPRSRPVPGFAPPPPRFHKSRYVGDHWKGEYRKPIDLVRPPPYSSFKPPVSLELESHRDPSQTSYGAVVPYQYSQYPNLERDVHISVPQNADNYERISLRQSGSGQLVHIRSGSRTNDSMKFERPYLRRNRHHQPSLQTYRQAEVHSDSSDSIHSRTTSNHPPKLLEWYSSGHPLQATRSRTTLRGSSESSVRSSRRVSRPPEAHSDSSGSDQSELPGYVGLPGYHDPPYRIQTSGSQGTLRRSSKSSKANSLSSRNSYGNRPLRAPPSQGSLQDTRAAKRETVGNIQVGLFSRDDIASAGPGLSNQPDTATLMETTIEHENMWHSKEDVPVWSHDGIRVKAIGDPDDGIRVTAIQDQHLEEYSWTDESDQGSDKSQGRAGSARYYGEGPQTTSKGKGKAEELVIQPIGYGTRRMKIGEKRAGATFRNYWDRNRAPYSKANSDRSFEDIEVTRSHPRRPLEASFAEEREGSAANRKKKARFVHFEDDKSDEDKPHPHSPQGTERRGKRQEESGQYEFVTSTFFSWRLKPSSDGIEHMHQAQKTALILARLHTSLSIGEHSKFYRRAYECTMPQLLERHRDHLEDEKHDKPADGGDVKGMATEDTRAPDTGSAHDDAGPSHQRQSSTDENIAGSSAKRSETEIPENPFKKAQETQKKRSTIAWYRMETMKRLLEATKKVLDLYGPSEGNDFETSHVSQRLNGIIDSIFRHLRWCSRERAESDGWRFSDFTHVTSSEGFCLAFDHCDTCRSGMRYDTATEALDHLYSSHIPSPAPFRPSWPVDDPHFVWLHQVVAGKKMPLVVDPLFRIVEQLTDSLHTLEDMILDVLRTVQSPSSSSDHGFADPYLPRTVLESFEQIVNLFIVTSNQMRLMNRFYTLSESTRGLHYERFRRRFGTTQRWRDGFLDRAGKLLDDSKMDILLSELRSPSKPSTSLGFERVSPRFLVVAVMSNVQSRGLETAQGKNLVAMCGEHLARLDMEARRRPQRRAFEKINKLKEEMSAIERVLEGQQGALQALQDELYGRRNLPTERWFITEQQRIIYESRRRIWSYEWKALDVSDTVRQAIDVLDESHGKAIRVFTIVTLFFLPLSFVSSFLGMNTTDIRDTNQSQTIFWVTALPVTAAVVLLSFAYGYKSDEIGDAMSRVWRTARPRHGKQQSFHPAQEIRFPKAPEKQISWSEVAAVSQGQQGPLPSWMSYKRRGRQKKGKNGDVQRRTNTFDSLLDT